MSYVSEQGVLNAQFNTEIIRCLPHVLMRPTLIQDGNAWLAIYGDLPTGVVGTGSTPAEAMADFDAAWTKPAVAPPDYGFARSTPSDSEGV
jgi:hypothetical protein